MLNFYTLKQALLAIFSVSFDIKPCFIVSSYKVFVSFTIFPCLYQDVFAEISQNLTISLLKTTIQP